MSRTQRLLFYNLVCRYGDRHALLDLAVELLLPALFGSHVRRYGPTQYFFADVGHVSTHIRGFAGEQLIIFGRFIKDTVLVRDQVYEPQVGLISDNQSMQSSPSTLFAIDLNNHKLVLAPEVPYAPGADAFATTLERFLNREREGYIRAIKKQEESLAEPRTLAYLYTEFPPAEITVTPLAGSQSVDDFVGQFAKITSLNIKLLDTNAEFAKRDLFREMRAAKDEVRAKTTTLLHESPAGLSQTAVAEEIKASASGGNQKILVRGTDTDGVKLTGDNNNIKLQVEVTDFPDTVPAAAEQMMKVFGDQISKNRLTLDDGTVNQDKIDTAREALRNQ